MSCKCKRHCRCIICPTGPTGYTGSASRITGPTGYTGYTGYTGPTGPPFSPSVLDVYTSTGGQSFRDPTVIILDTIRYIDPTAFSFTSSTTVTFLKDMRIFTIYRLCCSNTASNNNNVYFVNLQLSTTGPAGPFTDVPGSHGYGGPAGYTLSVPTAMAQLVMEVQAGWSLRLISDRISNTAGNINTLANACGWTIYTI